MYSHISFYKAVKGKLIFMIIHCMSLNKKCLVLDVCQSYGSSFRSKDLVFTPECGTKDLLCSFIFTSSPPPSPLYMFWPPGGQEWTFEFLSVEYCKENSSLILKINGTIPIASLAVEEFKFGVLVNQDKQLGEFHWQFINDY